MGGKVFSTPKGDQPALETPRMSFEIYTRMKDFVIQRLKESFEVVVSPAPAPEKPDYGDIDTLVQGPKLGFTWGKVGSTLNAHRMHKESDIVTNFAVPIEQDGVPTGTYAQVDVHVCSSGSIEWECMMDAYGDLWQIIGRSLRPIGLTATDKGLHVRVPEIERSNRKQSMIFLTRSVSEIFDFLGLDAEKYQRGFETRHELYAWCAGGKFFHHHAFKSDNESTNDRQRMNKREMFRTFINDWAPANVHMWQNSEPYTREDVLSEALAYFGKEREYAGKMAAWNAEQEEEHLWFEIKDTVLRQGGTDVNLVLRGLRRWVSFDSCRPFVRAEPEMDTDQQPRWASQVDGPPNGTGIRQSALIEWVVEHWEEVKRLEKERVSLAKARRLNSP